MIHTAGLEKVPATTLVVADFDTEAGLSLLKEALASMIFDSEQHPGNYSRFAFVHNPKVHRRIERSPSGLLAHLAVTSSLRTTSPEQLLQILRLAEAETRQERSQIVLQQNNMLDDLLRGVNTSSIRADSYANHERQSRELLKLLQLSPGEQALIVNGRVSGTSIAWDVTYDGLRSRLLGRSVRVSLSQTIYGTLWATSTVSASDQL